MQFNRRFVAPQPRWYSIQLKRERDVERIKNLGIIPTNVSSAGGIISCSALLDSDQRAQVSKFGQIKPL